MQLDTLITVIIPTYNRTRELARQLFFLSGFRQRYRVLVLDGGSEQNQKINADVCAGYQNVEHHRYDASLHLGMRICDGLKMVATPYVLMCGDDDFFFPDGVDECVDFLEHHPEHAAAIGKVWSLRYYPNKPVVSGGLVLGNDLQAGTQFDHKRFIMRSLFYFIYTSIGAIPLYYAVRRTEQTLKAFSLMTPSIKYSSMELLTNGMLLVDGGVGVLETPFGLRDYGAATTRDPEREGTDLYIPLEDQAYITPLLVQALCKKEGLEPTLAQYLIDSLLSMWAEKAPQPQIASLSESRWRIRLRALRWYLECVAGRVVPGLMSRRAGLDQRTYRAVLASHQRFTASGK